MAAEMSPKNNIILGLLIWTMVYMLCASDACMRFNYSVHDWRRCDTGNKEFLMFKNIPIQKCLLECRIRISCKAVKFLTIRRECGLLETDVNMATEYNPRPCVFIRMTDVEDIIPIPSVCQNCSTTETCDIDEERCVVREKCEINWIRIEQSCYHLAHDIRTADKAEVYCSSKRAHMVYIETEKENENMERLLNNTDSSVHAWVGITDVETESVWKFTNTNLNVTFTQWDTNQPDNYGETGEQCAVLGWLGNDGWNDISCSAKMAVICEKR